MGKITAAVIVAVATLAAVLTAPVSAQQFSPVDYAVMQRLCGQVDKGVPCVYDANNVIVGLAFSGGIAGAGELSRLIGGEWYDLFYQNVGLLVRNAFLYTTINCSDPHPYIQTGPGGLVNNTPIEQLPLRGAVAFNQVWIPSGTPVQVQILAVAATPPPVTNCFPGQPIGSPPLLFTGRAAVVGDMSTFTSPFSVK